MKRRKFITLLGSAAAAWPLTARAQQSNRLVRIGYLSFLPASQHWRFDVFRSGLRDLGYIEGKNLQIEFRSAEGNNNLLPDLAAELVGLNVDVIVTCATGVTAAQRATSTIPIVMATYSDAVATRVVDSLARPGGNITGSTYFNPELMAKRLELLKEIAPSKTRAGTFLFRGSAGNAPMLAAMDHTAKALGLGLQLIEVDRTSELEDAFSALANEQISVLAVGDHAFFLANANTINVLATKYSVLLIGPLELAASGGLLAYGVDFSEQFRRAAVFVDKILKGSKPSDIPVEQATKFTMTVNVRRAKALGLEVPSTLLARANEVIE
jgi:putative tryptophan/tyrosine transport system substrate-binding protein